MSFVCVVHYACMLDYKLYLMLLVNSAATLPAEWWNTGSNIQKNDGDFHRQMSLKSKKTKPASYRLIMLNLYF